MNKNFDNVKWIFFDVGFTLVSEEKATIIRAEKQAKLPSAIQKGLSSAKILEEMVIVSNEYQNQYKAVMAKYDIPDCLPYDPQYEELYDDAIDVLSKLSKKYHLGILANQGPGLRERLKLNKIDRFFEVVNSSYDDQLHKPDYEFFKLALKRANAKAVDCLMVGDRLDNDIGPAKALGFKTIRVLQGYASKQVPKNNIYIPDSTVNNLSGLLDELL